ESGIDCGGACPVMCPPENCNDGVQNQGEEWIDCGGPCPNICPPWYKEVQNGLETGVDCVIGDYPNYSGGTCLQCELLYLLPLAETSLFMISVCRAIDSLCRECNKARIKSSASPSASAHSMRVRRISFQRCTW